MLGPSRFPALLLGAALLAAAAWFALDDSAPQEPALSPHGSATNSERATAASLANAGEGVESAAHTRAASSRGAETRVAVPEREWSLRIVGMVVLDSDEMVGIADAEIELVLVDEDEERTQVLEPIVSDALGKFDVEVAVDPEWYDSDSEYFYVGVRGMVWSVGYSFGEEFFDLDLVEGNELELLFELTPGADVSGYVFDASGEPVSADVNLSMDCFEDVLSETADERGFYRFSVHDDGAALVRARSALAGTALVANVPIDRQFKTRVPDLYLAGSGSIGGVLVDPNGEPIAAHSVHVLAEELIENVGSDSVDWSYHLGNTDSNLDAERGDGLLFGQRATRADGSFLFEGLRPGRYMLLATYASNGQVLESTQGLFVTGDHSVRLVLGVHRLVVTLNRNASPQFIHCDELAPAEDGGTGTPERRKLSPQSQNPSIYTVEANRTYAVGLNDGSNERLIFSFGTTPGPWKVPSGEQEVFIQEGQYITHVELDPTQQGGRLVINVEDETDEDAYHVQIDSLVSGRTIRSGNIGASDLPLVIELAPGEYRVHVDCSAIGSLTYGAITLTDAPQKELDTEFHVDVGWKEAVVRAAEESHLLYRFETGGLLRVATPSVVVTSPHFPSSLGVQLGEGGWVSLGVQTDGLFNFSSLPAPRKFELENARGERTRRVFFGPSSDLPPDLSRSKDHDWRELSHPLRVGSYTLRWRDPEGKVHEERFAIRAREVTSVIFDSE